MDLSFETDGGIGILGNLGLIVLSTDQTLEQEMVQLLPAPGIAVYHSRIAMRKEVAPETLAAMEADLPASAALLPDDVRFDAIGYGCTSAATVIGRARVAAAVKSARPEAKVTEPISATLAACQALGVTRLGFLTPYVPAVSARMRALLEASGLEIAAFGSFNEGRDPVVARISPASILAGINAVAAQGSCDAVFVACTNLRCAAIVQQAERRIGLPVLSSNLTLAWHLLTLAGLSTRRCGFGRLFDGEVSPVKTSPTAAKNEGAMHHD
ncbi:MAG: aspartate/glutamate racemase family protein [Rhodospirillales bacterium]